MNISIFGLGYVGAVCAACWARQGHAVLGVDINSKKVDIMNQGASPIIERGLAEVISGAVKNGRLRATTETRDAVLATSMSMVCVGTPSCGNGDLDLRFVRKVCQEIGAVLKEKNAFHVVVLRSTVLPGTARSLLAPILEQSSGKTLGKDFGLVSNPEFLREGSAIDDFFHPPKTVIGASDARSADLVAGLYETIRAPVIRLAPEAAEMVKYADNAWHATKVVFANEIGNLCKESGIDAHEVMDAFCQDTKLNLSPYYLRPGFAFGGSCLPKDVRAISYKAKAMDLKVPLIDALLPSNQYQVERAFNMIRAQRGKHVGMLGLSFKAGTDDLRESPLVELVERLLGKGYSIKIFDRNVSLARINGANRDYLLNMIPHVSNLLCTDLEYVVRASDVLVVGNYHRDYAHLVEHLGNGNGDDCAGGSSIDCDKTLIDLVRVGKHTSNGAYQGICW